MQKTVTCLQVLSVSIRYESNATISIRFPQALFLTHRSPYTRCRLRLGLRPGVLSLGLPAFSISRNLRCKASASIASVALWMALVVSGRSKNRFAEMVGGVLDPTGVGREGV